MGAKLKQTTWQMATYEQVIAEHEQEVLEAWKVKDKEDLLETLKFLEWLKKEHYDKYKNLVEEYQQKKDILQKA